MSGEFVAVILYTTALISLSGSFMVVVTDSGAAELV